MTQILVISEPGIDGVKNHVINFLNGVNDKDIQVTLIYSLRRSDEVYLEEIQQLKFRGVHCERVDMTRGITPFDAISFFKILKIYRQRTFDVVHGHSSKGGYFARLLKLVDKSVTTIYTPHAFPFQGNASRIKTRLFFMLEKLVEPLTDRYICVSQSEGNEAIDCGLTTREKIHIVFNGVDSERFSLPISEKAIALKEEVGIPNSCIVVGSVGRITFQKNPELLFKSYLELMEKARELNLELRFIHVGQGNYTDELVQIERKLNNSLIVIPYSPQVEEYLKIIDVFVLSSRFEGMPIAMLEAMSCGCAVVGTDVTGINDIIDDEVGVLASQNPRSVSEAIAEILQKGKRNAMGEAARRKVLKQYSLKTMINKISEIYFE